MERHDCSNRECRYFSLFRESYGCTHPAFNGQNCPGFESHPLTTGLVAHESGNGETQEAPVFIPFIQCLEPMPPSTITFEQCQPCTNPVQISTQSNNGQTNPTTPAPAPVATDTISVEPRKRSEEGNSQAILDGSNSSKTLSGCQCATGPWRFDMENMPTDGTRIWIALTECDDFKHCRYSSARCTYKGEDGFEVWSLCPGIGIGREQIEAWAEIVPIGGK
jgi:hypothetical protein